jgi:hypothetical protein
MAEKRVVVKAVSMAQWMVVLMVGKLVVLSGDMLADLMDKMKVVCWVVVMDRTKVRCLVDSMVGPLVS